MAEEEMPDEPESKPSALSFRFEPTSQTWRLIDSGTAGITYVSVGDEWTRAAFYRYFPDLNAEVRFKIKYDDVEWPK